MTHTSLFTYLSCLFIFILAPACQKEKLNPCPNQSGAIAEKVFNPKEFQSIHLYLNANVTIHPATSHSVHVKGDSHLLNHINVKVENNTLKVENQFADCNTLDKLQISIGLPHLKQLLTTRENRIQLHPFSSIQGWTVNLTDQSTLDFSPGSNLNQMDVHLSRGAKLVCKGDQVVHIDQLNLDILGKGNFAGYPIAAKKVDICIEGSGTCKVRAQEKLDVVIYGDAKVICKGMPHFYKRINGSGNVCFTN